MDYHEANRLIGLTGDDAALALGVSSPEELPSPYGGRTFIDSPEDGYSITIGIGIDSGLTILSVNFYADGKDGHRPFPGLLCGGLQFPMSRESVVKVLGRPDEEGGGGWSQVFNRAAPHWIRYDTGKLSVRFEGGSDGLVQLVTVFDAQKRPLAV